MKNIFDRLEEEKKSRFKLKKMELGNLQPLSLYDKVSEYFVKDFKLAGANLFIYVALADYFTGNDPELLDPTKGIFISGKVGCGKTMAMFIAKKLCEASRNGNGFQIITANKYITYHGLSRYDENENVISDNTKNLMIDDIGSEPQKVVSFGTELKLIPTLIETRYNLWIEKGNLTHFTSNYPLEALQDLYGKRTVSRLREMCNIVKYEGEDRRK